MKEALLKRDKRILFVAVILMGIIGLGLVITTGYRRYAQFTFCCDDSSCGGGRALCGL
jgi:hypothetical protein